ncbi:MAG: hydrolase [Firmicutes bacterium]|nr:hydrolase [Bacillota bacterium]
METKKALEILKKYTTKPNLVKHGVAVSICMKHFAKLEGEDEQYWGVVGMLHDIDFEVCPESHCKERCACMLKDEGFDDKFVHAVQSHGFEICTDVEPKLYMEKVLSVVDQLSGFIIACALIRPEKKLELVTLESIHKRWKSPAFASGTDRARILRVCERMGKTFDYMAEQTLVALKNGASELGL